MPDIAPDGWTAGDAYEPYVGRWSRLVAREFLQWLGGAPSARWLDVGCGTGALTDGILRAAAPVQVTAVDAATDYVRYARTRSRDGRASFVVADARALPQRSVSADVAVSGLVLNFVPEPEAAIAEMARATRPGGTVAAYVWDYAGEMQLMRHFWDAALELDAAAAEFDEGRRFPLCRPDVLEDLWCDAGLLAVESRAITVPMRFRSFEDYWSPFLGGQGPAPGYAMGLSAARRAQLRERIRARLPVGAGGSIDLLARAWAVRGVRPS